VNCGCRDISGVIALLLEGVEVSNDRGHYKRRVAHALVALPHAVYTSGQMLEIHPQNCHFRHFSARPAWLAGGKAGSATGCSVMRSEMIPARGTGPGHPKTEWVWVHRNCHTDFR